MNSLSKEQIEELQLTEYESIVLNAFISCLYAEPGFSDTTCEDIANGVSFTLPQVKGVIGSLTKKNIVYSGESCDKAFAGIIYLHKHYWYLHPTWKEEEKHILIDCPTCKGTGKQKIVARMLDENGWHDEPPVYITCSFCNSVGKVTQFYLDERERIHNEIWCSCVSRHGMTNVIFYDDGEHPEISKHHYRCGDCEKVVQIG